ncbi:sulfur carrier protein ThiS [Solemya velesiana gill symbiont]|uniref:Thiamine biosynthesis protein ThiS n=1 Tax=Solemya velesiana gill symbiont TaxID=1918948 RepID=A0A1T2KX63_9GAMM|nr:sulfur carrier protein ThiS [Solemya velesiana gill symbiont]OOZ37435.1 thiamine biosynthesis protein ThiS [Solemya velesiana gill symbiont]
MQIFVNGEEKQVPDGCSMAALISSLDLAGQRIAVEVNEELVPRSTLENHALQPGDRVEIVNAIGGG